MPSATPGISLHRIRPEHADLLAVALDLLDEGLGRGAYQADELTRFAGSRAHLVLGATVDPGPAPLAAVAVAELLSPANLSYYQRFGAAAVELIGRHRVGSLSALAVRPPLRCRGVGTAVTSEVVRWAQRQGCDILVAVSWISDGPNPSRPLFEKLGFRFVASAPDVYLDDSLERGLVCPFCVGPCRCAGALYTLDLHDGRSLAAPEEIGDPARRRIGNPTISRRVFAESPRRTAVSLPNRCGITVRHHGPQAQPFE